MKIGHLFCENAQNSMEPFKYNVQTSKDLQKPPCNLFMNVLCSIYSIGNVTGNNTDTVSNKSTGYGKNHEKTPFQQKGEVEL